MDATDPLPTDVDRLNGWKEIASFLGKSVRTVQRWETEYGLPVRRLGHEGGEIVFASRAEIDQWSRSSSGARRKRDEGPDGIDESPPAPQPPPVVVAATSTARRIGFPLGVVLLVAAIISIVAAIAVWSRSDRPRPARLVVGQGQLQVLDDRGSLLWTHALGFDPNLATYKADLPPRHGGKTAIEDLDGDGRSEVVFGTDTIERTEADGLYVFEEDGAVRFHFNPDPIVRFGGKTFTGPWLLFRVFLERRAGGRQAIWAVFVHGLYYPTVAYRLDHTGRVLSTYWSNGYIESITKEVWKGQPVVLFGGANNESRDASLALLPDDFEEAFAPSTSAAFRCESCSGDPPLAFVLLPHSCLSDVRVGTATVPLAWIDKQSHIQALMGEVRRAENGDFLTDVWFDLDPTLKSGPPHVGDGFLALHDQWWKEGKIDHPFGPADLERLREVRYWVSVPDP